MDLFFKEKVLLNLLLDNQITTMEDLIMLIYTKITNKKTKLHIKDLLEIRTTHRASKQNNGKCGKSFSNEN
jgi:uncharacterized protein YueI